MYGVAGRGVGEGAVAHTPERSKVMKPSDMHVASFRRHMLAYVTPSEPHMGLCSLPHVFTHSHLRPPLHTAPFLQALGSQVGHLP